MDRPVIKIDHLTRRFAQTAAVDGLSLEVQPGEIFGFLGHNGAGKTTTVRLLNGVIDPTAGSMEVLGVDPQKAGAALRRRTGVLTETPSLDERLTAWDNLSIYADLYDVPPGDIGARVSGLLEEFELNDRAKEKVAGFSRGMKQRLALARALLHRPELLFLDEPTSGLDPLAARHVTELVERLARCENCTVFLCTHNLVEAQKVCDRVAILERGKLVALGTPAELARQFIRRLEVEIEVAPEQVETALQVMRSQPALVSGDPTPTRDCLLAVIKGREAIPALLAALVQNGVRVYRFSAREADLEQVYFALHDKNGGAQ